VGQIELIKPRVRRLGIPEGSPNAWYYRMPWVLAAATVMVLLVYVISLSEVVMFLYRHLVEASWKRLAVRRRQSAVS
jgi:hypothetical protein